jgi:hypothetical protein
MLKVQVGHVTDGGIDVTIELGDAPPREWQKQSNSARGVSRTRRSDDSAKPGEYQPVRATGAVAFAWLLRGGPSTTGSEAAQGSPPPGSENARGAR